MYYLLNNFSISELALLFFTRSRTKFLDFRNILEETNKCKEIRRIKAIKLIELIIQKVWSFCMLDNLESDALNMTTIIIETIKKATITKKYNKALIRKKAFKSCLFASFK